MSEAAKRQHLRHKYPESFSKIGIPKNKRHGVEDSLAERLFTPISMSAIENFVRLVMAVMQSYA